MKEYNPKYPHMSFMDFSQGKEWHYYPQEDITPYELAKLVELFSFSAHVKGVKWLEYIDVNNLNRHFIETIIGDELPKQETT